MFGITKILEAETVGNVFPKSGFENLAADATLGERLLYGLKICGIGMLIVFAVLVVICLILYVFKLFASIGAKKKAAAPAAAVPVSADESEETVVAIATAAIAASRKEKDLAFKVISVKKIK